MNITWQVRASSLSHLKSFILVTEVKNAVSLLAAETDTKRLRKALCETTMRFPAISSEHTELVFDEFHFIGHFNASLQLELSRHFLYFLVQKSVPENWLVSALLLQLEQHAHGINQIIQYFV